MNLYAIKNEQGVYEFVQADSGKSGYVIVPEQYTLADTPYLSVQESEGLDVNNRPVKNYLFNLNTSQKEAAITQTQKDQAVSNAYAQLLVDVADKMEETFNTKSPESATASYETWKDMIASPASYSSLGLKVDTTIMNLDDTELFDEGAALDTPAKITAYATRRVEIALAYGVWRAQRLQQFKNDKAAI